MIKSVLIILPTYNESENIGPMLKALQKMGSTDTEHTYDILVVDDNSPDGTQKIVRSLMKVNPAVHLLRGQKAGLGKAYIRGFRWGIKKNQYDAFVMMDADFSHDPKKVPTLIKGLESGSDYVIGSRYVRGGHIPGDWPLLRILNSKVANFLGHFLGGIDKGITDITGGFKAIRVSALGGVNLDRISAAGYFFQVNLLHEFISAGFNVTEQPISFTDRELGKSKLRMKDVVEFIYRAYTLNPESPIRRFIRFGLVGLSGTIVNLAALSFSMRAEHLSPFTADVIALEVSIVSNFTLNHAYTFRHEEKRGLNDAIKKLGRFNVGAATGAAIQFMIFSTLLKLAGVGYVLSDLTAIVVSLFWSYWMSIRLVWSSVTLKRFLQTTWKTMFSVYFALGVWSLFLFARPVIPHGPVIDGVYFIFLLLMSAQGIVNLYLALYAWGTPDRVQQASSPSKFKAPKTTFTILIPARHEESVIADTVFNISRVNYPSKLYEVFVVCDKGDTQTIKAARSSIIENQIANARVITYAGRPISKPRGLNTGLEKATKEALVIFDAEDSVHPDILNIANTLFIEKDPDIIQAGVQLMNYHSKWFSGHNVMEYYFWFKSRMHFNAKVGMVPLGGNTVFFKTEQLRDIGGWKQGCLTEDADIGIRMSTAGAKVIATYDARHITQEETPATLGQFIKQRTRWNQGFIQVLQYGDWRNYDSRLKRWFCVYTLSFPIIQALFTVLTPVVILFGLNVKLPTGIAVFSYMPLLLLIVQLMLSCVAMYEFIVEQKLKMRLSIFPIMVLTFIPYNILLSVGALRATYRQLRGLANWEKTAHYGSHRQTISEPELVAEAAL